MTIKNGNQKEMRKNALAGIAIMAKNDNVDFAIELAEGLEGDATLRLFEGNRFATLAATDPSALDNIFDLEELLEAEKLRYSLAIAVPVAELQTEPMAKDGHVLRTFCSAEGLPFRTKRPHDHEVDDNGLDKDGYSYLFSRPSFWLITGTVNISTGEEVFYGTLFGQYRSENGGLEYRPVAPERWSEELAKKVPVPVTKKVVGQEEAAKQFNLNPNFLFAIMKPVNVMADKQHRREGLRNSVIRQHEQPLTTLGATFPGLEAFKQKLEAEASEAVGE